MVNAEEGSFRATDSDRPKQCASPSNPGMFVKSVDFAPHTFQMRRKTSQELAANLKKPK